MDCAEEVALLRRQLDRLEGVEELSFDVIRGKMSVALDPAIVSPDRIAQAVASAGMKAEPWREQVPREESFWPAHGRRVLVAASGIALLAGVLLQTRETGGFLLALVAHDHEGDGVSVTTGAMICFLVSIFTGMFYAIPKALVALRHLRPDMNALMLISLVGAGILGEWVEGAMLAFLYGVSGLLENWSVARARRAIGSLMSFAPTEATVIHDHGDHRMPIGSIVPGCRVRVRPGERIPCDGDVEEGRSFVDQALITGESIPQLKDRGDPVFAGTLNGDGAMIVKSTRPPSDTTLARIIRMVEDNVQRRAPSERFVDQFARYYTPLMIALALAIGVVPPLMGTSPWEHSFYQAMLILLISCPCALVISTPVSIVSALSSAARAGVLIKGGAYLEEAGRLRAVAFDKTGVLTGGEPHVQLLIPLGGHSEAEVLAKLAALEYQSEHPLGRAILRFAEARGVTPEKAEDFHALQGRGAQASIGGKRFWAGSTRMLAERRLEAPEIGRQLDALADSEHTVVACGSEDEVWALIELADPVRPGVRRALEELRAAGIARQVMLTGDNSRTAEAVAGQLGLDEVRAELLPDDKVRAVEELKRQFGKVAMVGDGINDAQAIAASSVGIALGGKGTDVALETADVVLMSEDLGRLPFLIRHARRAVGIIKQNVVFAIAMKAIFLALAFAGMATLWMAIAADMGATLLVTLNGLRLLRAESRREPLPVPVVEPAG